MADKQYSGVYWDEKIPVLKCFLKNDLKVYGFKKHETVIVQVSDSHFSIDVRCEINGKRLFLNIQDIIFPDNLFIDKVKRNRKERIDKGLLNGIKGFDAIKFW